MKSEQTALLANRDAGLESWDDSDGRCRKICDFP